MKNWFTSLNGALALTALAWLSELWRAWLDMLFEYPGGVVNNPAPHKEAQDYKGELV